MKKRVLLVIGGIVLVAIITGGVLVFSKKSSIPTLSVQTSPGVRPTPMPTPKLLTWDDPAGFTFQYPEGLTVNNHAEDNDNYAHVELTSKDHPGNLIVWAKDTTSADVTVWVKTEKSFVGAPMLDTTLGSEPAKKVTLTNPDKLVTGAIQENILFMLETTLMDKSYWTDMHNVVANSFAFTPVPGGGGGSSGVSDEAVDETETVQ